MWIALALIATVALFVLAWRPDAGLQARRRHAGERRRRALVENALKHVHTAELRGALATPEPLASRLRLRVALLVSWGLSRTVLRGEPGSFTLELPPCRRPNIGCAAGLS
jgi:hypothetical protein